MARPLGRQEPCHTLLLPHPQTRRLQPNPRTSSLYRPALYDAEAILSNPRAFKAEEIRTLRDQITSNLERAWEITGGREDQLTGTMVQISQVVARGFRAKEQRLRAHLSSLFSKGTRCGLPASIRLDRSGPAPQRPCHLTSLRHGD